MMVTTASLLPMVLPSIPLWTVWVIRWFVLTTVVVRTNSEYLEPHLHIFPRVFDIDKALLAGDFRALMEITNVVTFESVLTNDVQSSYELCTASVSADSVLRRPDQDPRLLIAHA